MTGTYTVVEGVATNCDGVVGIDDGTCPNPSPGTLPVSVRAAKRIPPSALHPPPSALRSLPSALRTPPSTLRPFPLHPSPSTPHCTVALYPSIDYADCSAATGHGSTCAVAATPGYLAGTVICDTADGKYVLLGPCIRLV